MSIYVDIKTKSGIFRVKKPLGRIGAIHFGIITKYITESPEEGVMSPAQKEALGDGYVEWAEKVLPKIFTSFTPVGQTEPDVDFKAEDMTGEDQFAVFSGLMTLIEVSEDYFQVIKS